jgi:hypothetical protein
MTAAPPASTYAFLFQDICSLLVARAACPPSNSCNRNRPPNYIIPSQKNCVILLT